MERSAQQAIINVFTQVHKFSGLNLVCSLSTWDKCHSGAARLHQETLPLPAELALGAGAGPTAAAGGTGPGGATAPSLRRRLPPGRGTTLPREATQGRDPAAAAPGSTIRRSRASERVPRQDLQRRRGDSPRAGGSPRRRPQAARRWRPGPWPRSARATVPETSTPTREAQLGAPSADSPSRRSTTRALSRGRLATPTPNSDALREQPAAPFPRTREPPTSGRDRRTQDPDLGISLCAAPRDPDSRAAGAQR